MTKRPTPEMEYERDASLKALRVYVDLDDHPYGVELRFFDDGRIECFITSKSRMVHALADAIADGIGRVARRLNW